MNNYTVEVKTSLLLSEFSFISLSVWCSLRKSKVKRMCFGWCCGTHNTNYLRFMILH